MVEPVIFFLIIPSTLYLSKKKGVYAHVELNYGGDEMNVKVLTLNCLQLYLETEVVLADWSFANSINQRTNSTVPCSQEHRWTAPCKGFYKMQRAWMPVLETLIKTY